VAASPARPRVTLLSDRNAEAGAVSPAGFRRAYVALGSNLQDPPAQLRAALAGIARLPHTCLAARSRLYQSAPLGPPGQPDYCNAVCVIDTALEPLPLLRALLGLETAAGRTRSGPRWGPRVLDLDLLHVEGVRMDTPELTLPHPHLHERGFVLTPLSEVAPLLEIPGLGRVVRLAAEVGRAGLNVLARDPGGWFAPDLSDEKNRTLIESQEISVFDARQAEMGKK